MLKTKVCDVCGTTFNNKRKNGGFLGDIQFGKSRVCSGVCSGRHQRGVPKAKHTEEWKREASARLKAEHAAGLRLGIFTPAIRKKMSESAKRKPPMSEETRRKIGEAHSGERNAGWKGDKVGYFGLHAWVYKTLGRPKRCENCGTETARKFEWANRSRAYRRDISDWIRLCTRCHRNYDYGNLTLAPPSPTLH